MLLGFALMLHLDQWVKAPSGWLESVLPWLINTLRSTWYLFNKSAVNPLLLFWGMCVYMCVCMWPHVVTHWCHFFKMHNLIFMAAEYLVVGMEMPQFIQPVLCCGTF